MTKKTHKDAIKLENTWQLNQFIIFTKTPTTIQILILNSWICIPKQWFINHNIN